MLNVTGTATGWAAWPEQAAAQAQARYQSKLDRRKASSADTGARHEASLIDTMTELPGHSRIQDPAFLEKKRAIVDAALARARTTK